MTIPLDRLYTHLDDVCNRDDILISHWYPHGSKKASDLKSLKSYPEYKDRIQVIFHDQEPLDFNFYQYHDLIKIDDPELQDILNPMLSDPAFKEMMKTLHLRATIIQPVDSYDQTILVHSELNSPEVETYKKHDFMPVYWWAHGIISQDWFRYAKVDIKTKHYPAQFDKTFLIYSRAWSGTRQYRLKFLKDLKESGLHLNSRVNFSAWDNGQHYSDLLQEMSFEQCFMSNTTQSSASADYASDDYRQCAIELVLETVYESSRIHLTEKTCRPLACGKPFLLAAGPGSLKILRHYGFETFAPWINESYDLETDIDRRRTMIIQEMQRLNAIPNNSGLWAELHRIAARNRKRFFSAKFTDMLFHEFKTNFDSACDKLSSSEKYPNIIKKFISSSQHGEILLKYFQSHNVPWLHRVCQ